MVSTKLTTTSKYSFRVNADFSTVFYAIIKTFKANMAILVSTLKTCTHFEHYFISSKPFRSKKCQLLTPVKSNGSEHDFTMPLNTFRNINDNVRLWGIVVVSIQTPFSSRFFCKNFIKIIHNNWKEIVSKWLSKHNHNV